MKQYQTKPSFVNAVQWDESRKTLEESGAKMVACNGRSDRPDLCYNLRIDTYAGLSWVNIGDWIIEVDGVYTVTTDMIFTAKYEPKQNDLDG
jgi:hypothetical protein